MRTCGMVWSKCTTIYEKCTTKTCGDDLSCWALADSVDVLIQGGDSHFGVCKSHRDAQHELCNCVPTKLIKEGATDRLVSFYKAFVPEKLDEQGTLRDAESVWKKWKGREPELYFELTRKYLSQALDMRVWPEADVVKWQAKEELDRIKAEDELLARQMVEEEQERAAKKFAEEQELVRQQAEENLARQKAEREEAARLRAEAEKEATRKREEEKLARRAAEEAAKKQREHVKQLQVQKDAAIAAEDFLLAKTLKKQIDAAQLANVLEQKGEL